MAVLRSMWDTLGIQISTMNSVIHIPGFLYRAMDEGAKEFISKKAG